MTNTEPTNIVWDEYRGWIDILTNESVTHLPQYLWLDERK
jgi:hypothetical protein